MGRNGPLLWIVVMWIVIIVIITSPHSHKSNHTRSTTTSSATTTQASRPKLQLAVAEVDRMKVTFAQTIHSGDGKIDVVQLQTQNPIANSNRASIVLLAFNGNKLDAMPTVLKVSVPATYVARPAHGYPYWVIPLRSNQFKEVVFRIRSVGDTKYCIGGKNYESAKGRYLLCAPPNSWKG